MKKRWHKCDRRQKALQLRLDDCALLCFFFNICVEHFSVSARQHNLISSELPGRNMQTNHNLAFYILISVYIFSLLFYIFPMALTRRICLTVKSVLSW